jgi:hypothetical protein
MSCNVVTNTADLIGLANNLGRTRQLYKKPGVCGQFNDTPNISDFLHSNSIRELKQDIQRSSHVQHQAEVLSFICLVKTSSKTAGIENGLERIRKDGYHLYVMFCNTRVGNI